MNQVRSGYGFHVLDASAHSEPRFVYFIVGPVTWPKYFNQVSTRPSKNYESTDLDRLTRYPQGQIHVNPSVGFL